MRLCYFVEAQLLGAPESEPKGRNKIWSQGHSVVVASRVCFPFCGQMHHFWAALAFEHLRQKRPELRFSAIELQAWHFNFWAASPNWNLLACMPLSLGRAWPHAAHLNKYRSRFSIFYLYPQGFSTLAFWAFWTYAASLAFYSGPMLKCFVGFGVSQRPRVYFVKYRHQRVMLPLRSSHASLYSSRLLISFLETCSGP